MITIFDFPHGARGLRAAWLCEEMGLAHTFVPVGFPPDQGYRALNRFGTVPLRGRHVDDDGRARDRAFQTRLDESVSLLERDQGWSSADTPSNP